jgi:hypothetical protein
VGRAQQQSAAGAPASHSAAASRRQALIGPAAATPQVLNIGSGSGKRGASEGEAGYGNAQLQGQRGRPGGLGRAAGGDASEVCTAAAVFVMQQRQVSRLVAGGASFRHVSSAAETECEEHEEQEQGQAGSGAPQRFSIATIRKMSFEQVGAAGRGRRCCPAAPKAVRAVLASRMPVPGAK